MKNLVLGVFACLFLNACENSVKPHYILTDSQLHQYKDGDALTYGVINLNSDATGTLTHTFNAVDLATPVDDNETLRVISRNTRIEGDMRFTFPIPYFTPANDGSLALDAYSESGTTFWLSINGTATANAEFYPSPLSELIEQTSVNRQLFTYIDFQRRVGGSTSIRISPLGTETVETNYARFETYKINIDWSVTTNNDVEQKMYRLSGYQWVYPPLGVVMFEYNIESPQNNNAIFASLSSTNIKIANENKMAN